METLIAKEITYILPWGNKWLYCMKCKKWSFVEITTVMRCPYCGKEE